MGITRRAEAEYRHWKAEEVKLIGDLAVRFSDVCVHEFTVGDVEDPELLIASPIWDWQQTSAGKFVMEHAVEQPYWTRNLDHNSYGHVYRIMARLSEQNETFWRLKYVDSKN